MDMKSPTKCITNITRSTIDKPEGKNVKDLEPERGKIKEQRIYTLYNLKLRYYTSLDVTADRKRDFEAAREPE